VRVLILYNIARDLKKGVESDLICEQEITIIVPLVVELLTARGYQVETLETTMDLWEELKRRKGKFDIVLNMAEAFGGGNNNETFVPALLEALEIPFTGASSHNMQLTLDKEKSKLVVQGYGVPVTPYQLFRGVDEPLSSHLTFPLIVKPIREEGSIGIYHDSVVRNEAELRQKVADTLTHFRQPALVEHFIVGREISVGVIGNYGDLHVFPPLEFLFDGASSDLEKIRSYEYKWGGQKEQMVRADLSPEVAQAVVEYARIAFVATECRDYARFDFRVTEDGTIYLLEVNYNPGIGPNTHGLNNTLTMMASFDGYTFESLVERIVRIAAKREGLQ
jgi:D-alanine-D-alanine ligase